MDFFKKKWNNSVFRNAVWAFVTVASLIFMSFIFLDVFTRHGQSSPVPNFMGMSLDSARSIAGKEHLRIEVADSIFRYDLPRGAVYDQNPEPGIPVKRNRKIFITMNSLEPRKESVPYLVGMSLRQAKAELSSKGFRTGTLKYESDIATNNVLQQMYDGRNILPGVLLPVNSEIDLKLGLNPENSDELRVPDVVGRQLNNAKDLIAENSLNSKPIFDRTVKTFTDSLNAVVYKQEPKRNELAGYGGIVVIYLKLDK